MLHRCHNPPAPRHGQRLGMGCSPRVLGTGAGPRAAPRPGQGLGSWLRSPTALREATKHLQVSGGGGEGTAFASCGGEGLSSLSEVATATVGGRRTRFSLATVPVPPG